MVGTGLWQVDSSVPPDSCGRRMPVPVHPKVVGGARTVPAQRQKYFKLGHPEERCRIRPAVLRSGTERAPAPAVTHHFGKHHNGPAQQNSSW